MIYVAFAVFILAFAILFKSADFFVEGAGRLAKILHLPKIVIGVVLVGLATTAPEFIVSVRAASLGHPEIALGNAIGSVICDDGIALALAALLAPSVIYVNCRFLKTVGGFLLFIDFLAFLLARNGTLGRAEGAGLIFLLCVYFILVVRSRHLGGEKTRKQGNGQSQQSLAAWKKRLLVKPALMFLFGILGVIVSGEIIVQSAVYIARYFSISEVIIGATIIAIGTSLPEISTCVTAALKGEGEIAVGNIIGADVLNILWIIGVSCLVRPIHVNIDVINFTFPYMILIVTVMLVLMRIGCRLGKAKGVVLLALYVIYFILILKLFL